MTSGPRHSAPRELGGRLRLKAGLQRGARLDCRSSRLPLEGLRARGRGGTCAARGWPGLCSPGSACAPSARRSCRRCSPSRRGPVALEAKVPVQEVTAGGVSRSPELGQSINMLLEVIGLSDFNTGRYSHVVIPHPRHGRDRRGFFRLAVVYPRTIATRAIDVLQRGASEPRRGLFSVLGRNSLVHAGGPVGEGGCSRSRGTPKLLRTPETRASNCWPTARADGKMWNFLGCLGIQLFKILLTQDAVCPMMHQREYSWIPG